MIVSAKKCVRLPSNQGKLQEPLCMDSVTTVHLLIMNLCWTETPMNKQNMLQQRSCYINCLQLPCYHSMTTERSAAA